MGVPEDVMHEKMFCDYKTMYQILAENTYDWEFWLGPNGRYLYVSPAALRITGYEPNEFIEDPRLGTRIIHPDDVPVFEAHWGEVEEHRQMGEIELRVIHKDGRTVWISHACRPVFDKEGRYLGVRGSNRDITERKEAQEALRKSEKFANKVLTSSLNGLYIYDLKKKFNIFINPEYTRITGYTIEHFNSLAHTTFKSLFHEDDHTKVAAHVEAISRARDDDILEIEYRFRRSDGSWIWCLSRDSVFSRDGDGSVCQFIGTFLDITARREAEEELRRARDELEIRVRERTAELRKRKALLQEKNELLEIIFSNMHFLVAYLNTDFDFIRVNRAYAEADGRSPDFFPGKNHFDLFPNEENHAIFRKVVDSGETYIASAKPFEYPEHPERGVTYWDWSLFPVKGPKGAVIGLILCLVDVTKSKKAEEKLLEANQALETLKNRLIDENTYLLEEIKVSRNFDQILGESTAIKKVLKQVDLVSSTDATVLILGETGTGKELIARAIHSAGARSRKPLIKIDCASIPPTLIESELFGHEKGAFTGATRSREGRLSLADGGTVFLDEIGELPRDMQTKLLRVVQEGEFETVGSSKTRRVDIRVIAATNRDLWKAVQEGSFRMDLYYRLSVFPIKVPPLRDRGNDVALLASFFAQRFAEKMGRWIEPLSEECLQRLKDYDWPGNVRELQNAIERAVITSRKGVIDGVQLAPEASSVPVAQETDGSEPSGRDVLTVEHMRRIERENVLRALEASQWRVSGKEGAARTLGMPPSTLNSRMKALGIKRPA
ncbi:MAG: sigma 54-interacting transcriptional regulator [Deltaproteobacteria bacterium]|nr:sigma 54-interacting transcriptional regulator [Deltaproteobacteria bacterium]